MLLKPIQRYWLTQPWPESTKEYTGWTAKRGRASSDQAGNADRALDFDPFDLVQVQQAAKYLTGDPATWGEGDWNGAPGGSPGSPPPGDRQFNQLDIVAALSDGKYLIG